MTEDYFLSRAFELGVRDEVLAVALRFSHIFVFRREIPDIFGDFAFDLLASGKFRLPFDKVFYEFSAGSIFNDSELLNDHLVMYCFISDVPAKFNMSHPLALFINIHIKRNSIWSSNPNNKSFTIFFGNSGSKLEVYRPKGYSDEFFYSVVDLCLEATGVLAYSDIAQKQVVIPTKLQRARHGKPPLYDFKIVELTSSEIIKKPPIGTHAPPALHWRRGHYRRLIDKIVYVSPCLVGSIENGIVEKIYDATELGAQLNA